MSGRAHHGSRARRHRRDRLAMSLAQVLSADHRRLRAPPVRASAGRSSSSWSASTTSVCAIIAWRIVRSPVPGWLMVGASLFWSAGAWYPLARHEGMGLAAGRPGSPTCGRCSWHPGALLPDRAAGLALRPRPGDRGAWVAFLVRFVGILLFSSPTRHQCGCAANPYAVLPSADADFWLGLALARRRAGPACSRSPCG